MFESSNDRREAYRVAVELLAVLAVLADVTLTRAVVGGAHATEIAPGSAWLISTGGYAAWAAVLAAVVVGGLGLARWLDRTDRRLGWGIRTVVAGLPLAVAVGPNTAGVLATGAWPETVAWGDVVGLVGVVLAVVGLGVLAHRRPDPRRWVAAVPSADRPLVVASVLLVVLSAVLAGVPAGVFGPGAPAESVDRAAAATEDLYVASENGNVLRINGGDGSTEWTYTQHSSAVNDVQLGPNGCVESLDGGGRGR